MSLVSGTNYSIEVIDNKNVIINGNFDIWQRGTSFAAAGNVFTADRFQYEKNGTAVHTLSRSTVAPTFAESGVKSNYSLKLDVTTADPVIDAANYTQLEYNVEGYDYARLAGGDVTLSFWVHGTKTGIYCVSFRNSGSDRSYVAEYTINTTGTWEKKTITIPFTETGGTWDYINGIGLRMGFQLAVGSTYQTTKDAWQTGSYLGTANQVNATDSTANDFYIAQVQLEKGDVATPFEFKNYADEVARCQRYYSEGNHRWRHGAYATGAYAYVSTWLPVVMRDSPTVTQAITVSAGWTFQSIVIVATNYFQLDLRAAAPGVSPYYYFDWTADAEL